MKAVRSIETKQVFYLFDDSAVLNLGDRLEAPGLMAIDINDKTHEIVDAPQPELFVSGGVLTFDTDWAVLWPQAYDDAKIVAGQQAVQRVRSQRAAEYPPIADYIDGIVKGDQAQMQAYIDACLAVKAKYPKP
jgi:hypothetical protein